MRSSTVNSYVGGYKRKKEKKDVNLMVKIIQWSKRQHRNMNGSSEQNLKVKCMDAEVTKNGFKPWLQLEDLK